MQGDFSFWTVAVLLPISMTAASLITSQLDSDDWRHVGSVSRPAVALFVLVAAIIVVGLIVVPPVFLVILTGLVILGIIVGLISVFTLPTASSARQWAAISIIALSAVVALILVVTYEPPIVIVDATGTIDPIQDLDLDLLTIFGFLLGIMAMVITWPRQRYRGAVGAALVGMIGLNFILFTLWQAANFPLVLAKSLAIVVTVLVAYVLARYVRRQTVDSDEVPCERCQQSNDFLAKFCQHCGFPISPGSGTR